MARAADFNELIDLAGGLVSDASCTIREATFTPLPAPHRRLTRSALGKLESAQQDLFRARNCPWSADRPRPRQLELL